ncbi:MAG: UvrD-helicase domain-containing protein, partial [Bacillota bacterium]|nr:UvrD-helicase domain-containing protein [Bacillota bacterium]
MDDYLDKLNPRQREAATHTEGPLMILAGAGSGKTSTMTCRIAYLIREKGVSPYNILAVTFTNKAAGEMKERVEAILGGGVNIWIMTFHAACLRILRISGSQGGLRPDFVVYDPADQKAVVKSCAKARNVDSKMYPEAYVLSVISDCKEKGLTPEQYEEQNGDSPKGKVLAGLYRAYEKVLAENNAMDFDDLLLKTVRLLETCPEVLRQYQERFHYIMVDEYQDTNQMQYRFIKLLAAGHHNLCIVGDDDQCIYQWRGADIRNILNFERDFPGTKVVKLEQNYRSCSNILDAANSVIRHNAGRKEKTLWTDREPGDKLRYYRADDDREEARYVAAEIDRLQAGGRRWEDFTNPTGANAKARKWSEFAVLYRTNAQSRRFEEALTALEIPYRVLGGWRYYDRKEVKDLMAYMRLVQNPADDLSLTRIINEPRRGVGEKTLEKFRAMAQVQGQSLFDAFGEPEVRASLPEKTGALVGQMVGLLRSLAEQKDQMKISDIYDALLTQTGYAKALQDQGTPEAEGRMENLLEFKSLILDFEEDYPQSGLTEFMERVALMSDIDNHDPREDAVTLMTLHSAKGLEFPVVFMPGLEEGLFPGWRAYEKADGLEEERRLCYVGMTRAKERLYLTSAYVRTLYGRTDYTKESVFLRELDKSLVDGDAVYMPKKTEQGFGQDRYNWEDDVGPGRRRRSSAGPFDRLTAAQKQKKTLAGTGLAAGEKVSHAKFGAGTVIEVQGDIVTVAFDTQGIKK